jgi:hypothetical protein
VARDIDYAATAVKKAVVEKYGKAIDLNDLDVIANERTISVRHEGRAADGTRPDLLAAVRDADDYAGMWAILLGGEKTAP